MYARLEKPNIHNRISSEARFAEIKTKIKNNINRPKGHKKEKMNIKKWWKYSGILLMITAILHTFVALIKIWKNGILAEIVRNGVFNSIGTDFKLGMTFWFFICGIMLWIFGQILHYYIKREQQPAPKFLGWFLLIFSIIGVCFIPLSGFWLFIPQGLIILVGKKSV